MSAPVCKNCRGPVEDLRHGYATPVCFACLKPSWQEAEIARLRAALASIAALQTQQPVHPIGEDDNADDVFGGNFCDAFEGGERHGNAWGKFVAAEMARAALVKP